jgi:hypothetical protein
MQTAIGVFAERERAEEAVKSLLEQRIPKDSIIYLTRSETEAKSVGKELGAYAGGFVGGAAGLSAQEQAQRSVKARPIIPTRRRPPPGPQLRRTPNSSARS